MPRDETASDFLRNCLKLKKRGRTSLDPSLVKRRCSHQWSLDAYITDHPPAWPSMVKRCSTLTSRPCIKLVTNDQIHDMFEKMLDEMNLTEEKKVPLRNRDAASKIEIMKMHVLSVNLVDGKLTCLDDYITRLSEGTATNMSAKKLNKLLESIRVALFSKPISWVEEFADRGLDHLTLILIRFCYKRDGKHEKIIQKCIWCYRAFLVARTSVDLLLKTNKPVGLVLQCINAVYVSSMIEALKFVADLCYALPEGMMRVLDILSNNRTNKELSRFESILEGLHVKDNYVLLAATLRCINAIINSPEEDALKLKLREELMRDGLFGLLNELDGTHNREVKIQLDFFWNDEELSKSNEFQKRTSLRRQTMRAALDMY